MREKLTYNYWLIITAWCMFLNDYTLLAIIFCLTACIVLTRISKRINHYRAILSGLIIYIAISLFLLKSNVTYFFPKLPLFLAALCINCAVTNEYLYLFKPKFIVPYLLVMVVSMSVFSIITILLPNGSYSLFTKNSLFLMESLIFLPYLIPLTYCLIYKKLKSSYRKASLKNKEATM